MRSLLVAIGIAALTFVGCGPSNTDKARSQVEVISRLPFNDTNFKPDGTTGQDDPWGHEITWEIEKGIWNYIVLTRSSGPDGLPYTGDDVVAKSYIAIDRKEGVSESIARGLTRGATKGIREGLKAKINKEK